MLASHHREQALHIPADYQSPDVILTVVLQRAALFCLIDIDRKLLDLPGENKQGDQVGNRHQTVEGICNIPKQTKVDCCTDDRYKGIGYKEGTDELFSA